MKKVLSLLKPHVPTLIFSIIFATVNTVLQLLLPVYTRDMLSEGVLKSDMHKIIQISLIMLAFSVASIITSILNTYFSTKTSVGYAISLRTYIFEKVSRLSQSDIDKIGVASLVTRTTNDVRQVHDVVLGTLKSLVPLPIMLIGGLFMIFKTNASLAKKALWCIPVIAVLAVAVIAVVIPIYSKIQKLVDKMNQIMREKISGIRVIRAFNRTEYEDRRFAETNKTLTDISLKAARIMAVITPFLSAALYVFLCVIVFLCVNDANSLDPKLDYEAINATIPNMYQFITYFSLVLSSVTSVVGIVISIPRASISGRRIKEIMDAVSDIKEPENPVAPLPENRGTVEFRNVGFKYKPVEQKKKKKRFAPPPKTAANAKTGAEAAASNKPGKETKVADAAADTAKAPGNTPAEVKKPEKPFELKNVSFFSKPGEITAIIGITGSGKTTLMNLIPRLYDVTEGEVLVAGVNVKEIGEKELQKRIAVVPQQAYLFSGTIADNIRYGKPDATDEEIWKALETAQAKSFVAAMPDGINSFVSQAGKNFSGGQKQRLAIARAVVKGAEIILFDDSFSALDLATDARLRASLKENLTETNLIIVAQRVGTVINADRIVVLDNGEVVGQGTHKELINTCEIYREIVATQLSEEAVKEAQENE